MRLFINSRDNNQEESNDTLGNKIRLGLNEASITTNKQISISVVKANIPQTISNIALARDGSNGLSPRLTFSYDPNHPSTVTNYTLFFNNQYNEGTTNNNMILNTKTTMAEIVAKINLVIQANAIQVDASIAELGFQRLKCAQTTGQIVFNEAQPLFYEMLGILKNTPTTITAETFTPYNYNMAALFPNVYVKSRASLNTYNSNNLTQSNTLACIPLGIGFNVESNEDLHKLVAGGSTNAVKNRNLITYQNPDYLGSHKSIFNNVLDSIHLDLVDKDGEECILFGHDFSIELDVKIIQNNN